MQQLNLALLVLRVIFGLFLACHGLNKLLGGGKLPGTERWFGSMGMKWPYWQARIAMTTEIGAGAMFAAGFLTPLAAAAIISVMLVAIIVEHWKVGFFVFKPNQGWEYCGSIAFAAFAVATAGPGEWSLDHAITLSHHTLEHSYRGWTGALVAALVGVGGALVQLTISYRPKKSS